MRSEARLSCPHASPILSFGSRALDRRPRFVVLHHAGDDGPPASQHRLHLHRRSRTARDRRLRNALRRPEPDAQHRSPREVRHALRAQLLHEFDLRPEPRGDPDRETQPQERLQEERGSLRRQSADIPEADAEGRLRDRAVRQVAPAAPTRSGIRSRGDILPGQGHYYNPLEFVTKEGKKTASRATRPTSSPTSRSSGSRDARIPTSPSCSCVSTRRRTAPGRRRFATSTSSSRRRPPRAARRSSTDYADNARSRDAQRQRDVEIDRAHVPGTTTSRCRSSTAGTRRLAWRSTR